MGAFCVGNISGAMFNPAVATGLIVTHSIFKSSKGWKIIWIYFVGPVLGSILGYLFFNLNLIYLFFFFLSFYLLQGYNKYRV